MELWSLNLDDGMLVIHIGDTGYLEEVINFQDVIALLLSKLNTPDNLATLNHFYTTFCKYIYIKIIIIFYVHLFYTCFMQEV